jgi:hypothetical protein
MRRAAILVGIGLLLSGCGDPGPERHDIAGSVTYQGQPLPAGLITFEPDLSQGNDGPPGFAHIINGHYDTAETESGSVGGPQIVRIQGFDGKPGAELPMGRPLFDDFQTTVDLPHEKTTRDFAVP